MWNPTPAPPLLHVPTPSHHRHHTASRRPIPLGRMTIRWIPTWFSPFLRPSTPRNLSTTYLVALTMPSSLHHHTQTPSPTAGLTYSPSGQTPPLTNSGPCSNTLSKTEHTWFWWSRPGVNTCPCFGACPSASSSSHMLPRFGNKATLSCHLRTGTPGPCISGIALGLAAVARNLLPCPHSPSSLHVTAPQACQTPADCPPPFSLSAKSRPSPTFVRAPPHLNLLSRPRNLPLH